MARIKITGERRRKPVNLSLRQDIVEKAKALNINVSRIAEDALIEAVRTARQQAWLEENADAIAEHNKRVEKVGMFNESLRRF